MSDSFGSIFLKEGRDSSIRHRHPWIFSGAIERASKEFEEGDIARICDSKGEVLGFGHVAPGTIALKVLQFGGQEFDVGVFCRQKIQEALWLRAGLGLLNSKTTTAFRLLHAEGDGMPGLVADYYAGTVVLQFHSMGMLLLKEQIVAALQECLGQKLHCVYQQETTIEGAESGPECAASYLFGEAPTHQFLENGLHFQADWEQGQKTGFFLDQRENRELLRKLAPGRTVLNCFSYTGGFSCAALAGGASKVVSVDSSALALAKAKEVVEKNFPEAKHECIEADCRQFLREIGPGYDCIVLDPPAFIKHRGAYKVCFLPLAARSYYSAAIFSNLCSARLCELTAMCAL
jgi:23S rRNA (cytosine1962-C5)-methyltransferase